MGILTTAPSIIIFFDQSVPQLPEGQILTKTYWQDVDVSGGTLSWNMAAFNDCDAWLTDLNHVNGVPLDSWWILSDEQHILQQVVG